MNPVRVSVIMPVFNTERYVADAIRSVLAEAQEGIEMQLICVNDGSTDGTGAILASFGAAITVVDFPENRGIAAARNAGLAAATGDYITFLDADDLWESGRLKTGLRALAQDPALDLVFAHYECFISSELDDETKRTRECPPGVLPGYLASTMLARASSFRSVGSFDETLRVGEFLDWYARARELGLRSVLLPDSFLKRRIHDRNTGVTQRDARGDYVRVVMASLLRKRQA